MSKLERVITLVLLIVLAVVWFFLFKDDLFPKVFEGHDVSFYLSEGRNIVFEGDTPIIVAVAGSKFSMADERGSLEVREVLVPPLGWTTGKYYRLDRYVDAGRTKWRYVGGTTGFRAVSNREFQITVTPNAFYFVLYLVMYVFVVFILWIMIVFVMHHAFFSKPKDENASNDEDVPGTKTYFDQTHDLRQERL